MRSAVRSGMRTVFTALLLHYYMAGSACGERMVARQEAWQEARQVELIQVEVPEIVRHGDDVQLRCKWDAPSDKLYSVKWYLNDREFFRYKPEEEPAIMVHALPGVTVDKELSTGEVVVLKSVQLTCTGNYKCEVITEAPNFHTADKMAHMTVIQIPEEKPLIYGTKNDYKIGDTAYVTCVSAESRPPTHLTWYINDQEAPREYLVRINSSRSEQGLTQTRLGLQFKVSRDHFRNGEMNLRCSAKISSLYYKTQQHSVDGQLTYSVPVMESRDISAFSGSRSYVCGGRQQQQAVLVVLAVLLEVVVLTAVLEFPSS
ncbi:cell adhesion molecule 3-like [Procambarus clarkii]|uniref:cell adhesion molecule 3-like n=1 Tax=Procambarus clarkii TaxID=6728 RepID=UPI00374469B1